MEKIDKKEFIYAVSIVLLIWFSILQVKMLFYIALAFLLLNLFNIHFLLKPIEYLILLLKGVGNIISKVVLSVIYYGILFPIAIPYKIFNRQLVNYFHKKQKSSYFSKRNEEYKKSLFDKVW